MPAPRPCNDDELAAMDFSPRGTPGNTTCELVQAAMLARPAPAPWFIAVNAALLAAAFVTLPATALAWTAHRHLPRIRARSFAPAMLALAGMAMICGGILARNLVLADGRPAASCPATTFFVLAGVAAVGNAYWMESYVTVRRLRRARLAREFDLGMDGASVATRRTNLNQSSAAAAGAAAAGPEDDEAGSAAGLSAPTSLGRARLGWVRAAWGALKFFVAAALMLDSDFARERGEEEGGTVASEDAARASVANTNTNAGDADGDVASSARRAERSFRNRAQLAWSGRALRPDIIATMFVVCNLPPIALYVSVEAATPAYADACVGCEWYWELAIGLLVTGSWFAFIATRASIVIVRALVVDGATDALGIYTQLLQCVATVVVTFFPAIVLRAVDPGGLQRDFFVVWCVCLSVHPGETSTRHAQLTRPAEPPREWIIILGLALVWLVVFYRPLMDAREEARQVARVADPRAEGAGASELARLLSREAMLQACLDQDPDWLSYCERRYLMESVRCITDVCTWKSFFYDKGESWRRAKAGGIYASYVSEHAVLECNVDARVRGAVERSVRRVRAGEDAPAVDMFDGLLDAVMDLVYQDGWRAYVAAHAAHGRRPRVDPKRDRADKALVAAAFMPQASKPDV